MSTTLADIIEDVELERVPIGVKPYIEIGDVDTETKEIVFKGKTSVAGAVWCPPGVIVVSKVRPNRGAVALIHERCAVSSAFTILKPINGCLTKFLFYRLAWNKDFLSFLQSRATGATYPTVKEKDILSYELGQLPDLAEQQRIVALLEEAEGLKKARATASEKSSELIRAIFLKMFGDPASNPMGWEVELLGNHVSVEGGFSFKSNDFVESGIPLIRIGDISHSGVDTSEGVCLPESYADKYKRFLVSYGDILMGLSGATTGKTGMVKSKLPALLNQRVGKFVVLNDKKIAPEYLFGVITSAYYQKEIWRYAIGGAQPNVSPQQLEGIQIPLPSLVSQIRYGELVREIEIQLQSQREANAGLDGLFFGLLSRSFVAA